MYIEKERTCVIIKEKGCKPKGKNRTPSRALLSKFFFAVLDHGNVDWRPVFGADCQGVMYLMCLESVQGQDGKALSRRQSV